MSKAKFAAAKELIQEQAFYAADVLLQTMPADPTAQEWRRKIKPRVPDSFPDELREAIDAVILKNDAKTSETHEVNSKGKIARKERR